MDETSHFYNPCISTISFFDLKKSMKKIYLLPIVMLALMLLTTQHIVAQHNVKKFEWLVGKWKRTDMPGTTSYEHWTHVSETELHGAAINLMDGNTAAAEEMKIVVENKQLYFVADVPENENPVYFKITSVAQSSFECENPEHDFPKKIVYAFDGKVLKATISGDGKAIDYLFERVE